jgi:heme A synthase
MPWQELITRTISVCFVLTGAIFAYTYALLVISRIFDGIGKFVIGMLAYLVLAALIGGSIVFILQSAETVSQRQSAPYILAALVGWFLAVVPGFLHLRSRLPQLQRRGFFLPRPRV